MNEEKKEQREAGPPQQKMTIYYRVRFREQGRECTVGSKLDGLAAGEVVMIKTDHGLEPAVLVCSAPDCFSGAPPKKKIRFLVKKSTDEEQRRYQNLASREDQARKTCLTLIDKHKLSMKLIRVERYFDGSKMIFYFTAEKRVDFRGLVKDLVQEFRTRVEMRQIGVRHETKMIGGLGACGRELCCASFMKKFDSVSIKMAKEQDLPLNPSRISGVCNRLLCCLTYEHATYRRQRKGMPKCGRRIVIDGEEMQVMRQVVLSGELVVSTRDGGCRTLTREEWQSCKPVRPEKPRKKKKRGSTR